MYMRHDTLFGRPNGRKIPPAVPLAIDKALPAKKPAKEIILRPIHPNAGVEAEYRKRLTKLIDEMERSVLWWVRSAYRSNTPEIAADESPASAMRAAIRRLTRRWNAKFDQAAKELSDYFATSVSDRSDAALKSILKRGGFSVEFKMTRAQNDVVQATIAQNVSLIKSIPSQCLTQVEGIVMRSVQSGRDLATLSKELHAQYGVTKKRAAFIARSQNGMATASMVRARQIELGITTAIWQHSSGGKEPRPEHVAFSGKEYDISKGAFLEGKWTFPGTEPNCRCVSRAKIKGFS